MQSLPPPTRRSVLMRIWRSIRREPLWPSDERGRMRVVMNDLLLHLHPPRVPAAAIRFTYTYGLGGLAVLLIVVQVFTGVLLTFAYVPSPEEAYQSLVALQTEVWFGQIVRNLHHWSGNLLLVVAGLHLLRVFYTSAFHTPREFNWELGLSLLALVAVSNFTGYLLPWDQLSYWAVTVGTSLLGYIPLIGESIKRLLLGGPEVGATTLSNFYSLHVLVIPLVMLVIVSFHIWRVRKDRFSLPRRLDEGKVQPVKMVTTIPHLVSIELLFALVVMALLLVWSAWVDAPLLQAANPGHPPNPAKAAWYFMGIQELLLHFHPTFGAVIIPALLVGGLIALPYLPMDGDYTGIWFGSRRGRRLVALSLPLGVFTTVALVLLDEFWLDLPALLPMLPATVSNGVLPLVILMLAVVGYGRLLRARRATRSEARMAIFTLLLAALVTLTAIGIFFRGEGMALLLPWEATK